MINISRHLLLVCPMTNTSEESISYISCITTSQPWYIHSDCSGVILIDSVYEKIDIDTDIDIRKKKIILDLT